jgi:tetratricopeptide (TPR) repeat protein
MDPVSSAIALNVLGNFATDLIKWIAGSQIVKIEEAIQSTADAFQAIEGLSGTLIEWLHDERVGQTLASYIQGDLGQQNLPIQDLVSALLEQTQFYLPDHAAAVAEKIVSTFIWKIRGVYLADPAIAGFHIANRLEAQSVLLGTQHEEVLKSIETLGGLKPSLERQFRSAVKELETGNLQIAFSLLQSLLVEVESAALRLPELERSIHAKLGNVISRIDDKKVAAIHLRRAAELDKEDPVRAAINAAWADMFMEKHLDAYERLDQIQEAEGSNLFHYWNSKAMALVGLERFDEAIEIASRSDIGASDEEKNGLTGAIYLHALHFDKAAAAYEAASTLNPKSAEWHFGAGEMLLFPLIGIQNEEPIGARSAQFVEHLGKALNHFKEAGAIFRKQGRQLAALHANEKLALAYCLHNKCSDAIPLLEPVVQHNPNDRQNLLNLGFAYLAVKETSKAADVFRSALLIEHDANTERVFVHALVTSGQTQKALEFLSEKTTAPINERSLASHLNLAIVLSARREYSKAKNIFDRANAKFPEHPEVLLSLAEFYESMNSSQAASIAYSNALKNAAGRLEAQVRVQYGHFCFKEKDFSRAVELWKPLMRNGGPRSLSDPYLIGLFNTRNYAEVIRIVNEFSDAGVKVSAVSADLISSAYEHLDDLEPSRRWLEYLCDLDGNRPEYIMRLAQIDLRLGRREQALELLDASKAAVSQPAHILGFAKAYSLLGKPQEALDLAFLAAQLEESAEIYSGYVGAFLAAKDDEVQRSPEQIGFFQNILATFQERFPNAYQIQAFHVDPNNPLDAIRDTLEKYSQQVEQALTALKERRFPLTTFAKAINRDMYEVWLHALVDSDRLIFCAVGTEEEAVKFQEILVSTTGVMLDLIALFTFVHLGMLDKLRDVGDIYIAQQTLDYLHYMQSMRKIGGEKGTMGMIRGQFFMTEISAEDAEKINSVLNRVTEWVEQSGQIKGFTEPLNKDEEKWEKVLGESTLATLTIAKQRSVTLLTDDKILADLARQSHGLSSVNSQAVLVYLHSKGSITTNEYDDAVLKLAQSGYGFIRVTEEQFFLMLDREDFQLTPPVIKLFQILDSSTTDINSACAVTAGLLYRLFLEIIPQDVRDPLGFHILNTLVKHHSKMKLRAALLHPYSPESRCYLLFSENGWLSFGSGGSPISKM